MAASFLTLSLSSSSSSKLRSSFSNSSSFIIHHFSPTSSPHLHSRRVRATISQENEKVILEETFQHKKSPYDGNGNDQPPNSVEKWVVKLEQSVNIFLTDSVIKVLDTLYHDRDYPRFFVLETIARVPYFAFISVLHMYESFGWWRKSEYLKVHFAESWNEMHHLLIMEVMFFLPFMDSVLKYFFHISGVD